MRAAATCVMTVVFFATQFAYATEPIELSLDGEWEFTYTASSTVSIPQLPAADEYDTAIKVPGRWDDQLVGLKNAKWWPQAQFRTTIKDRAGNVSRTMTGGWITGNASKSLEVTVVDGR